ncbi:hypothetical protein [Haliangium ochraceum]|uniref:Uncharacterized protein n=1 Tax=Haliangium ochraceum (strain DSM 14365 / JCM 11303 / SMP-2) TaxID=502025 RepID=D0LVS3_HALO1|nr:hypothetical protein [Haliangium ochraceum]ACY14057.1 hypothetical protein Hoch_1505 [Haliangium ochraceum DSM 14365]
MATSDKALSTDEKQQDSTTEGTDTGSKDTRLPGLKPRRPGAGSTVGSGGGTNTGSDGGDVSND